MKYKVGDKVVFKNVIFVFNAEILEVYKNDEFEEDEFEKFDYYIKYENYEEKFEEILVKEKDIIGYQKGTEGYLIEKINKLLQTYSKEEILKVLK